LTQLTERQKRFIDYYIVLGNATEAAIKAGYSKKTAGQIGEQNLKKLEKFIHAKLAAKEDERIASGDEVLRHLSATMRGETVEEIPIFVGKGVQVLTSKSPSVRDRLEAAKQLAKRYGLDGRQSSGEFEDLTPLAELINDDTDTDDTVEAIQPET